MGVSPGNGGQMLFPAGSSAKRLCSFRTSIPLVRCAGRAGAPVPQPLSSAPLRGHGSIRTWGSWHPCSLLKSAWATQSQDLAGSLYIGVLCIVFHFKQEILKQFSKPWCRSEKSGHEIPSFFLALGSWPSLAHLQASPRRHMSPGSLQDWPFCHPQLS